MNRHSQVWMLLITGAIGFTATLFCGCQSLINRELIYGHEVPHDKIRTIEPLPLEEAAQEPNQVDVNMTAPATLELSIEQCRAMALENNLELQVSLIESTIVDEQMKEERAKFEAAFFSNVNYSKSDEPVAGNSLVFSSKGNTTYINTGVTKPLPTGGEFTANIIDMRLEDDQTSRLFNPAYDSELQFSISQPLLRNGGTQTGTYSIRMASYQRQTQEMQTKLAVITLLTEAERAYWELYAAQQELDVRQRQYDLAEVQLQQVQRLVDAGERPQVEVIRAEAGLAERREAIIQARNTLYGQQRVLKRIINLPIYSVDGTTMLIPTSQPVPARYLFTRDHLLTEARNNRMDLLEYEIQLASNRSTLNFRKNQRLPDVSLKYTYGMPGLGESRADAYDLIGKNEYADHTIGVQLNIPIGNGAAESQVRQSLYERVQLLKQRKNKEMMIEAEVLNAIDNVESNWQRILAGQQNTILTGRLYEAEKRQFELGSRTSTDVLDAQAKLADAQSAEIRALTDYKIALVELAQATGTLLGAANIEWEPLRPNGKGLSEKDE